MLKSPMNAVEPVEDNVDIPPTLETSERVELISSNEDPPPLVRSSVNVDCETDNKMGIFRRVSRVTPFDIASLAVSCVSMTPIMQSSSSVVGESPDPDGADCCRSLMELSRWINPSRSSRSDKSNRQNVNKRKAQRFDIAFLTRPSTEEDSSTGSGSRSDSQSPELDVVALDSCKSEEDNENPKQKSSRPLAVIRGSKRMKTSESGSSKFTNQNVVEDLTYSKMRESNRTDIPNERIEEPERAEEMISAFKKVERNSLNTNHHPRTSKQTDESTLLQNANQTRILLPNTSLVNGGLRPHLDSLINNNSDMNSGNKMGQYSRFQLTNSSQLLPGTPVELGLGIPSFPKTDSNFQSPLSPRRGSGNNLLDSSIESSETPSSSGNSNYATKSYTHPLLPFLPPSLAALTFPTQNWCAKCNASFRMTSDLVYHMRSHHKKETDVQKKKREEKLRCEICHESFRERHHLTRHMTSHQ